MMHLLRTEKRALLPLLFALPALTLIDCVVLHALLPLEEPAPLLLVLVQLALLQPRRRAPRLHLRQQQLAELLLAVGRCLVELG